MSNKFTRDTLLGKDNSVSHIKRVPMSFAQEGLWFLEQQEPATSTYNVPQAFHLTGPLVEQALQEALNAIVVRHEAIRTTYEASEGVPVQVIHPPCPVDWAKFDLSALPERQRNDEAQALVIQEAHRPFDLSSDLMLRARLFRLETTDHILLLVMHHIATDGWSADILLHELSVLYNAKVNQEEAELPELTIQYSDYALRQREHLQGSIFERDIAYWRRQLEGVSRLNLPTDRTQGAEPDHHGASISVNLPTSIVERLKLLGSEENATLFMVFLAALMTMLRRYTGQDDICVGTPIAGRIRSDVENMIGLFADMLVLREDLSGEPSFRDFLRSVRSTCLNAYEHQELPFERLVAELQPTRVRRQIPLFQVTLVVQHEDPRSPRLPKLTSECHPISTTTSKFELRVAVRKSPSGFMVSMTYATALFDRETIQRALEHYKMLLQGIADDATQPISGIPMLPVSERNRLLAEWNDTKRAYPENRCIYDLFEAQVEKTPDRIAVVFGDESLTYHELAERVEHLAIRLHRCGIRRNVSVGIRLERSINLLISILAVLKTGGTYVPFDLAIPRRRSAFMLKDAGVRCLITQQSLDSDLPSWKGDRIVLDDTSPMQEELNDVTTTEQSLPDDVACIFYTSGSTGKPKGIRLTHRGVVNHLVGVYATLDVQPDDVILQSASPAFDMSLRTLVGPLVHGARAVLLSEWQSKDPLAIVSVMQTQNVTAILGIVPSLLAAVVDTVSAEGIRVPSLRLVATAGETHPRDLAQKTLATFGRQIQLYNLYGPTESTGTSTAYRIEDVSPQATSIPIGHPLPNVRVYVLDRFLHLAGIGIPGELYLAGPGVARGYVNRPELTAERFIPSPFHSDTILYKTGDRGRWLASGELEFLGRVDRQIKLRGYRIELGGIEAVIGDYPAIRQAVVTPHGAKLDERQLVAYLISDVASGDLVSPLQEYLRERLPRYMIPNAFVVLDELPLTTRGKVDYSALPRPSGLQRSLTQPFVAPRTPFEKAIAAIWKEILHIDRIGIHDDFFELGGHSLSLMRVAAAIDRELGARPSLRALYEAPTVEGQSIAVIRKHDNLEALA